MWPFKKKEKTQKRIFAGAAVSRLNSDWVTQGTSQDSEIKTSLVALRNRTRQLVRDNEYVKNAVREVQNNVVGQGIGFQSQVRMQRGNQLNELMNDSIESAWEHWKKADSCDVSGKLCFAEFERLIMSEIVTSGEVLIRIVKQKFGKSKIPFALELIDADYLDETYNLLNKGTNDVRMGVEVDKWGRPVAYHLRNRHPYDSYFASKLDYGEEQRRIRVPAEEIIHLFVPDRPRQTRGISWFAAALMNLKQMAGYMEASVVAARSAACLMGFIETPEGELTGDGLIGEDRVTDFEAGVIKKLNAGEKINVPQLNKPSGEFEPFMRLMLRGVASSMGMSYEAISKDYSQSNYSSSRMALLPERDNWRIIQQWLIGAFHEKVFDQWLEMAVLTGELDLPRYELQPEFYCDSIRWLPRGWQFIDPMKDAEAAKMQIRSGLSTVADVLAQQGKDYEELLTQRQREVDLMESMDLIFDTSPDVDSSGKPIIEPNEIEPAPPDENSSGESKNQISPKADQQQENAIVSK